MAPRGVFRVGESRGHFFRDLSDFSNGSRTSGIRPKSVKQRSKTVSTWHQQTHLFPLVLQLDTLRQTSGDPPTGSATNLTVTSSCDQNTRSATDPDGHQGQCRRPAPFYFSRWRHKRRRIFHEHIQVISSSRQQRERLRNIEECHRQLRQGSYRAVVEAVLLQVVRGYR